MAEGEVDLARQFVNWEFLDREEEAEAIEKTRRAVEESGCWSVTHFLLSKINESVVNQSSIRTLIFIQKGILSNKPLYGVERWGGDGLCFVWEELLAAEEDLERCMETVGSLCCTSLQELQLGSLQNLTPKLFNNLCQHFYPHRTTTLKCLRQWDCQFSAAGDQVRHANITLPASLLYLEWDTHSLPIKFLEQLPPPAAQLPSATAAGAPLINVNIMANNNSHNVSTINNVPAMLTISTQFKEERGDGQRADDVGRNIMSSSSNSSSYITSYTSTASDAASADDDDDDHRLSSLVGCLHQLNLQGLVIWVSLYNTREAELRNVALHLANNKSLKAFSMYCSSSRPSLPEEFATQVLNKSNTTLTTLHIHRFRMPQPSGFDLFFEGAAANQTLTQLSLRDCEGSWTPESILDSLQENGTLYDIDLTFTPLEDAPAIAAQLGRNKSNAEMMKKLGINQKKVQPTTARLFLCGEPFAGKTTIVKSMTKLSKSPLRRILNKDWILYNKFGKVRPRTKGIEVTSLKRDNVTVSIWDMAGQAEYQCFHDYVFPDLSDRSSPSFFLYVWSPISSTTQQQKTHEDFKKELEYWLKFITSKTRRSKKFIPNLMIALTRKDRYPGMRSQLSNDIKFMKEKFVGLVELFDSSNTFEIDARDPSSMNDLNEKIFDTAELVLKSVKPIFQLQEIVRSIFERKRKANMISPLITRRAYMEICDKEIGTSSPDVIDNIALLLNNSGDFIYSQSSDFIILDTHWFCHTIMGNIIHYTGPSGAIKSKPGFFPKEYIEDLLEKEQISSGNKKDLFQCLHKRDEETQSSKVSGEQLLQLLCELHLVCRDHNTPEIFLPSNLESDSTFSTKFHIQSSSLIYRGRRLKCRDIEHTFLAPGVFSQLQVKYSNHFDPQRIVLQKTIIDINHEVGVHILIDFSTNQGKDQFMDILAEAPSEYFNNETLLQWISKNIIMEIIQLCASNKGIQGVEIIQEIIRPSCVEESMNSPMHKTRQTEPLENLQNRLEEDLIKNHAVEGPIHAWKTDSQSTSKDVPIDKILDLLSVDEVQSVYQRYRRKLDDAVTVMNKDFTITIDQHEKNKEKDQLDRSNEFQGVNHPDKEVIQEIYVYVKRILREVEDMKKGMFNIQDKIFAELTKLQTFMMQSKEKQLPSMCLLSIDKGHNVRAVIAKVVRGFHEAQLHLLCENKAQPHLPKGALGVSFSFVEEKSFLEKALPYMQYFLKFTYIATKVGAHLMTGAGGFIPDFSQVFNLVEDWSFSTPNLTQFQDLESLPEQESQSQHSRANIQHATHTWLWDFLKRKNYDRDDQIHKYFNLRPMCYKKDGSFAWLCDDCISQDSHDLIPVSQN